MTLPELKEKIKLVESEAKAKKDELVKQFCIANNPYKVGDIFEDHIGKIRIEKIKYSYNGIYSNQRII